MRLPFPERVSLFHVFVFCLVLCSLQVLEGTSAIFTLCTFGFVFIAAIAFNVAGGLTRPSGGYVISYAILAAILGIVAKVFLNEPGQSNLRQPERTIEVYLGTIVSMLAGVLIAKKLRSKTALLPKFRSDEDLYRASVGSLIVGLAVIINVYMHAASPTSGGLQSALQQMNKFQVLAIVLGVMYEVKKSNGRRSMNWPAAIGCIAVFAEGIFGYSKQAMFTPFIAWFLPAAAGRCKISITQIAVLGAVLGFLVYYLVPYSQYGRVYNIQGASFSTNWETNKILLSNLGEVRRLYLASDLQDNAEDASISYFNRDEGFLGRLQMIGPDDALVDGAETGEAFGIFPTIFAFQNVVPHFLWPGKPTIGFGNVYAHQIGGILSDDDETTGISFSPSGDAFFQAKWVGIFALLPVLFAMLFTVTDSVTGDTRTSAFALLVLVDFLHAAPEAGATFTISGATTNIFVILVVALITIYVMPLIANLVLGPPKQRHDTVNTFEAVPSGFAAMPLRIQDVERTPNAASGKIS